MLKSKTEERLPKKENRPMELNGLPREACSLLLVKTILAVSNPAKNSSRWLSEKEGGTCFSRHLPKAPTPNENCRGNRL